MDNNEKLTRWGVRVPFPDGDWIWVCEEDRIENFDENTLPEMVIKTFDTREQADAFGKIYKKHRVEIYDDRARTTGQE
jgi:hypothetical protein